MVKERQSPGLNEGAKTGDIDDEEVPDKAKSAEDRKAAAALSKLAARDEEVAGASVDQEGLNKAINKLSASRTVDKKEPKRVKVEAADVALLSDELDLTKIKATELLRQHDGDAVKAMRAFVTFTAK